MGGEPRPGVQDEVVVLKYTKESQNTGKYMWEIIEGQIASRVVTHDRGNIIRAKEEYPLPCS